MLTSIKRISIRSLRAPKQLSLMTSSFGRSSSRRSSFPSLTANPMKKQLNVNAITNELQGGSAFFPGYKQQVEQTEETVAKAATQVPVPLTPAQTPPPAPAVAAPK